MQRQTAAAPTAGRPPSRATWKQLTQRTRLESFEPRGSCASAPLFPTSCSILTGFPVQPAPPPAFPRVRRRRGGEGALAARNFFGTTDARVRAARYSRGSGDAAYELALEAPASLVATTAPGGSRRDPPVGGAARAAGESATLAQAAWTEEPRGTSGGRPGGRPRSPGPFRSAAAEFVIDFTRAAPAPRVPPCVGCEKVNKGPAFYGDGRRDSMLLRAAWRSCESPVGCATSRRCFGRISFEPRVVRRELLGETVLLLGLEIN